MTSLSAVTKITVTETTFPSPRRCMTPVPLLTNISEMAGDQAMPTF